MAYNTTMRPGESLEQYYRRLAKVADQRLVRLERLSEQENYKVVKDWAYKRAQEDIERWGGSGRFNTAPPQNTNQLKAKINDIRAFLESGTSTQRDINAIYKKRADTINTKYGTKLTWQDIAEFYGRDKNEALDAKYGSKQVAMAIGIIQQQLKGKDEKGEQMTVEKLQSWARARKNYHNFYYKKADGTLDADPILDHTVHKILRSPKDIAAMYELLARH